MFPWLVGVVSDRLAEHKPVGDLLAPELHPAL